MAGNAAIAGLTSDAGLFQVGSPEFSEFSGHQLAVIGAKIEPVGLVRPGNVDQLSSAVAYARAKKLGILRIYGPSQVGARLEGDGPTLVIDLSRMNRIFEINDRHAYARIEPGVTFADLSDHIDKHGLPLLVDAGRDPSASVLGSCFAKGIGFTPYADHALMQCGGEWVLPNAKKVRTGMGAMEDNRSWQLYKYALGPYSDGLAIQSDLMIPSQAGIWLMGKVPAIEGLAVDLGSSTNVAAAVDIIRPFKHSNTLAGTVHFAEKAFDAAFEGGTNRKADWRMTTAIYGLPKVVELSSGAVRGALASVSDVGFPSQQSLATDRSWQGRFELMSGKAVEMQSAVRMATLSFAAPLEGACVEPMLEVVAAAKADGVTMLTEFAVPARALLLTVYFPYKSSASLSVLAASARALIAGMSKAGFGLIGESLEFQKLAKDAIGKGAMAQVHEMIARAVS